LRLKFEAVVELFSFDDAYLQRLRARDRLTERHFVDYFSRLLDIKLRSRLRSSQSIEDIKQETFARVFGTLGSEAGIRQPDRLGAFVNSVCNNVLFEFYRSSARNEAPPAEPPDLPDKTINLDGQLITRQTMDQVRQVLEQLPKRDRDILRAVFLEEKDKDEVCREFGVDRDYLRVLLHRAKQNFKAVYQKAEGAFVRRAAH
jgi:RNA polymerase sigma-70 factor, ECF subfamily